MQDVQLSKDARAALKHLVNLYNKELSTGEDEPFARTQAGVEAISLEFPKWSASRCNNALCELDRAGLVDCFYADDAAEICALTDSGIDHIKNAPRNAAKTAVSAVVKIIGLVGG